VAGDGDITFRLMNGADGDIAKLEGGTLRLYYIVTGAAGPRPPSRDLLLDVGQPQASLPEPAVEQAPPPDYVFNPEQSLGDARILVRAHTDIRENDTITLHFEGSAAGGSAPSQPFKVLAHWVGKDLPFTVRRSYVLANLDGSARIYYTLTRENERTRISHPVNMRVGSALNLPVPQILEGTVVVPGQLTRINPLHVLTPPIFTIRVRYAPMLNSDEIKPFFNGKLGLGSPDIAAKPGNASQGYVDFIVSNTAIAANLEQPCVTHYEVKRAGASKPSDKLEVEVQALPSSALDLVTVPEAAGGVIDARGSNSVLALEYPFMRSGQAFWIDLKSRYDFNLRNGVPVSQAEFNAKRVVGPIPNNYLDTLTDGDNLTVQARVSLDGTGSKNSAVPFVIPQYRIKKAAGIVATINVGTNPDYIAISADGSRAYVTNGSSHTVSVIDTHSNKVIHTITGLSRPYRLTLHPDGSRLYVGNYGGRTISVINTTTHGIIQTITGFSAIRGITFNASGSRLYVSNSYVSDSNYGFVYIHDTATGNRLNSLRVDDPTGLAFNPGETRLYAVSNAVITRINPAGNGSLIGDIPGTSYPEDIVFSPHDVSTPYAYITNLGLNNGVYTVTIVDATNDRIHKTLSGFNRPFGIAMNPITPRAYVTGNVLSVIDTDTQTVISSLGGFNNPRGVAVTPNGLWAYVVNYSGNTVSVVAL
jgi:YVTN family beta-propeller protein